MIKKQIKHALVSVIIPAYNADKFIDTCINSIMCQSYTEIEIIIINDGSDDKTSEILNEYASVDDRIIIYNQSNHGLVYSRKKGLEFAKGEYCIFVDADDYLDRFAVESMVLDISKSDCDLIHYNFFNDENNIITPQRGIQKEEIFYLNLINERIDILKKYLFSHMTENYITPSIWSKIYKTELIREWYESIPDSQQLGEDFLFLIQIIMKSKKIKLSRQRYYYYRILNSSMTHKKEVKKIAELSCLYKSICDLFSNYGILEELQSDIDGVYWDKILQYIKKEECDELRMITYQYPFIDELQGKKIILYGAGTVGKDYYMSLAANNDINVVGWIDKNKMGTQYMGYSICGIELLQTLPHTYDYILLAIDDEKIAKGIKEELVKNNIERCVIKWEKPRSAYNIYRKEYQKER